MVGRVSGRVWRSQSSKVAVEAGGRRGSRARLKDSEGQGSATRLNPKP
jgi:hypothetical protein